MCALDEVPETYPLETPKPLNLVDVKAHVDDARCRLLEKCLEEEIKLRVSLDGSRTSLPATGIVNS